MRKKINTFLFCCLFSLHFASGQTIMRALGMEDPDLSTSMMVVPSFQIPDSTYLRVTYKYSFVTDTTLKNKKSRDILQLEIGHKVSKFYSERMRINDSLYKESIENNKSFRLEDNYYPQGYEIFKYPYQSNILVTNRLPLTENIYTYTDSISDLKWDILPEKAKYLDYKCQKAKTHFRGRDYIALFTTDIPCNNGPWKFCNLPGLILKVSDKDNFFVFEAISVLNANMPIKQYNWKSKSINKDTWYKMERSCHEKAGVYLKTHNINLRKFNKNGEVTNLPDDWTVPYNPIER